MSTLSESVLTRCRMASVAILSVRLRPYDKEAMDQIRQELQGREERATTTDAVRFALASAAEGLQRAQGDDGE